MVFVAGVSGCGGGPGPSEAVEAQVVAGVGLRLQRTTLDRPELQQATTWGAQYVATLAQQHPELSGLTVQNIAPVFDESAPTPIGAMLHLITPAAVPRVVMDLIRSRDETPQRVPSAITQLRALDVIYEFQSGAVTFLGISPQPGDAMDPATATELRPLDPEKYRDPGFGDDE